MKKKYLVSAVSCVVIAVLVVLSFVIDFGKADTTEFTLQYKRPDFEAVMEYIDTLEENLGGTDQEEYKQNYLQLSDYLKEIATENRLLMIERYDNTQSVEKIDEYDYFFKAYNRLYRRYAQFMDKWKDTESFSYVTSEWTKEQRDAETQVCEILDETYEQYTNRINALNEAFYRERADGTVVIGGVEKSLLTLLNDETLSAEEKTGYSNEAKDHYYKAINRIYLQIAAQNQAFAKYKGYRNFEEYSFAKDTPDEQYKAKLYHDWVRTCLVPLYYDLFQSLPANETAEVAGLTRPVEDSLTQIKEGLSELSDDMYHVFCEMLETGHCGLGAHEGKSTNNYTTYLYGYEFPYMSVYTYENYIDVSSILHEYGHYYTYSKLGSDPEKNMDFFEAMAQMMNASYWCQRVADEGVTTEIKLNLLNILQTAILSSVMDELEHYIYSETITDTAQIDGKYVELLYSYNLIHSGEEVMGFGRWQDCTLLFTSPFYYRSYLVASIPTICMLSEGLAKQERCREVFDDVMHKNILTIPKLMTLFCAEEDELTTVLEEATTNVKRTLHL